MFILELIGFFVCFYHLLWILCCWLLDSDILLAFYTEFGKPTSSLKGKVVWIVGASTGIGEHLAYVLAKAGCKLILSSRRQNELERVKANCLSDNMELFDKDIEVCSFDVCDLDVHETMLKHITNKFGRLDIIVSNAGRSQRAKWEDIHIEVDKQMFNLNVFSHLSLCRLVSKYFLTQGHGHVVVTSSTAGVMPVPFSATYCATKHALHGYFGALHVEACTTRKPIAVTMVCPGPTKTNFLAECFTDTPGQKFGTDTKESKNKISAARCAELMGIAIANQLSEVWIAQKMVLFLMYMGTLYPRLTLWILKLLGPRYLQQLRDSSVTVNSEK